MSWPAGDGTSAPPVAAAPAQGGYWVRGPAEVLRGADRGLDPTCQEQGSFTIGEGSGNSSYTWSCPSTGRYGSLTTTHTWTVPPATMSPGQAIEVTVRAGKQVSGAGTGWWHACATSLSAYGSAGGTQSVYADNGGYEYVPNEPKVSTGTFVAPASGRTWEWSAHIQSSWNDTSYVKFKYEWREGAEPSTATTTATATATPTPTAAFDLTVGEVEITQVIQCMFQDAGDTGCSDNSVPLVRGKRTAIRVYPSVSVAGGSRGPANNTWVTGRLRLVSGGGQSLAPVNGAVLDDWKMPEVRRGLKYGTINFHLPAQTTYTTRLTAEVTINPDRTLPETNYNNNTKQVTFDLSPRRDLRLWFVHVGLPSGNQSLLPNTAIVNDGHRIIQQWFPVRDLGVRTYQVTNPIEYEGVFPATAAFPSNADVTALLEWFNRMTVIARYLVPLGGTVVDQWVAWIHMPAVNGGFWYGRSDPPWANPPGMGQTVLMRSLGTAQYGLAHEVAHNLGARHPNTADACGALDPGSKWPYANARIQEAGYDLWTSGGRVVQAALSLDLMTYCRDDTKWMSPHTYITVTAGMGMGAGTGSTVLGNRLQQASGEIAVVGGTVHRDGRVEIDPLVRSASTVPVDALPASGAFCVELGGAAGTQRACFDVDFLNHDQQPVGEESFLFVMPVPAGAERVRVTRAGSTVAERRASAHAPVVRVDHPQPGAVWDGPRTVRWTGSDADGDALTYTILYTRNGADWLPINGDLTSSEIAVDFTHLPGSGAARVRVLASDGFHTTTSDSGPFTVPARPPRPVILRPADGAVLTPAEPVDFLASGDDPEDIDLDESMLQWFSDRDGSLGSGAVASVNRLSAGTHLIRLRARDADGNFGEDTILLHVRPSRAFLPMAARKGVIGADIPPGLQPLPTATRPSIAEQARQVIARVNEIRAGHGLSALTTVGPLGDAAEWYAGDMARNDYIDDQHYDRLDRDAPARVQAFGYGVEGYISWRIGESVAAGPATAREVVDAWMGNRLDRAHILDPALCEAGAGFAFTAGGAKHNYWALDFGCRGATVPTPGAPTPTATRTRTTVPTASSTRGATTTRTPVPTPSGASVYGRVTRASVPIAGVTVELLRGVVGNAPAIATTQTDADGDYLFTKVPSPSPGEFLLVHYGNSVTAPNPDVFALKNWWAERITTLAPGERAHGGDFDIEDVELLSPERGAEVVLPATFCWQPRTIGDGNHRVVFVDTLSGVTYESPLVGRVSCVRFTSWAGAYDREIFWFVSVYQPTDPDARPINRGDSLNTRKVVFRATPGTPTPTPPACRSWTMNAGFESGPTSWAGVVDSRIVSPSTFIVRGATVGLTADEGEWLARFGQSGGKGSEGLVEPWPPQRSLVEPARMISASLQFSFGVLTEAPKNGVHDDVLTPQTLDAAAVSYAIPSTSLSEEMVDPYRWYQFTDPIDVTERLTRRTGWDTMAFGFNWTNNPDVATTFVVDDVRLIVCERPAMARIGSLLPGTIARQPAPRVHRVDAGTSPGIATAGQLRRLGPMRTAPVRPLR